MMDEIEWNQTSQAEYEAWLDSQQNGDQYAEFLMSRPDPDRPIYNGDALVDAMEDGFMFDEFLESLKK
jgi:hypothetical protein